MQEPAGTWMQNVVPGLGGWGHLSKPSSCSLCRGQSMSFRIRQTSVQIPILLLTSCVFGTATPPPLSLPFLSVKSGQQLTPSESCCEDGVSLVLLVSYSHSCGHQR